MKTFVLFIATATSSVPGLFAQQRRAPVPKPSVLPYDRDCEKLKGGTEVSPNRSTTILKRGTDYYVCRPKSHAFLARAKTAAIVVRSTQTISCGDGSGDSCIREDTATERQVEEVANRTDLWRYFDKAAPAKADLILPFIANGSHRLKPDFGTAWYNVGVTYTWQGNRAKVMETYEKLKTLDPKRVRMRLR